MEQERDEGDLETCPVCGAEIDPALERSYAYGQSGVLCHTCARSRGGVYDAERDCWTVEPDLSGLPDERRPHR